VYTRIANTLVLLPGSLGHVGMEADEKKLRVYPRMTMEIDHEDIDGADFT
jgi:hypothetical protein